MKFTHPIYGTFNVYLGDTPSFGITTSIAYSDESSIIIRQLDELSKAATFKFYPEENGMTFKINQVTYGDFSIEVHKWHEAGKFTARFRADRADKRLYCNALTDSACKKLRTDLEKLVLEFIREHHVELRKRAVDEYHQHAREVLDNVIENAEQTKTCLQVVS